jgi:hypothetical protein
MWQCRDSWFVLVVLGVSLSFNLYFVLGSRLFTQATPPDFVTGANVPILRGEDLKGAQVEINWGSDARPTIVYIFSPSCVWCTRNIPNIRALDQSQSGAYRLIGISLSRDGLNKYVTDNSLQFPVYTNVRDPNGRPFAAKSTPETITVSPAGKITDVWRGAYDSRLQKRIESKWGVHLPGLT